MWFLKNQCFVIETHRKNVIREDYPWNLARVSYTYIVVIIILITNVFTKDILLR